MNNRNPSFLAQFLVNLEASELPGKHRSRSERLRVAAFFTGAKYNCYYLDCPVLLEVPKGRVISRTKGALSVMIEDREYRLFAIPNEDYILERKKVKAMDRATRIRSEEPQTQITQFSDVTTQEPQAKKQKSMTSLPANETTMGLRIDTFTRVSDEEFKFNVGSLLPLNETTMDLPIDTSTQIPDGKFALNDDSHDWNPFLSQIADEEANKTNKKVTSFKFFSYGSEFEDLQKKPTRDLSDNSDEESMIKLSPGFEF